MRVQVLDPEFVKTSTTLRWVIPASELPSFTETLPVAQAFEPASAFCAELAPLVAVDPVPDAVLDAVAPLLWVAPVVVMETVGVDPVEVEVEVEVEVVPLLEPQPLSAADAPRMSAPTENALMNTRPFMGMSQLSVLVDMVRARFVDCGDDAVPDWLITVR